jgi:hypothetical protein
MLVGGKRHMEVGMPLLVYLSPVSPPAVHAIASLPAANAVAPEVDGELGPNDFGPPPAPGTEVPLTNDPTGVAAHCEETQQVLAKRGLKLVRKMVSQNAHYGVVWRADVTTPGDAGGPFRMTCWRIPGRTGYSVFLSPLHMFDASQSIPPLGP